MALANKVQGLWKTTKPFQLMDMENDYYLVKFQDEENYSNVLTKGPWTNFCQYLTVRPGSPSFSTSEEHPTNLVVWVWLPRLPEGLYNKCLLRAIGEAIGPVLRIDYNTNNRIEGRLARLTVCVDLRKPLISELKINGRTQRVEYESLPNICFECRRFGHSKDLCPHQSFVESKEEDMKEQPVTMVQELQKRVEEE